MESLLPKPEQPDCKIADGEIRAAIKAGAGIYLAGSVKIDCPGPDLCTQQKCKTGEPMMTLHVFGFDEDGIAGARTLLTALMPLSTMGEEEKVEYERNVRGLIRVGTRAAQGLEDAAKTMSQTKIREVEEEEEDETATFCTRREIDERSARRELAAIKAREALGGDEIQEDIVLADREHKGDAVVVEGMTKSAVMETLRASGAIELLDGTMPRGPGESIIGIQAMTEYKGRMEEDTGTVTKVVMGSPCWEDLKSLRTETASRTSRGG